MRCLGAHTSLETEWSWESKYETNQISPAALHFELSAFGFTQPLNKSCVQITARSEFEGHDILGTENDNFVAQLCPIAECDGWYLWQKLR